MYFAESKSIFGINTNHLEFASSFHSHCAGGSQFWRTGRQPLLASPVCVCLLTPWPQVGSRMSGGKEPGDLAGKWAPYRLLPGHRGCWRGRHHGARGREGGLVGAAVPVVVMVPVVVTGARGCNSAHGCDSVRGCDRCVVVTGAWL